MGKCPVGDFLMSVTWYTTFISFLVLLFRKILKRKTIFDFLFRKKVKDIQQNIVYNNESDKKESEFPSLFKDFFDRTLSVIIIIDETNYSILNRFTEIGNFFNQIVFEQGLNFLTYEFIIVNNNKLSSNDIQYLQMQPKVRVITLNVTMGKGTAIQIGSFAANGKYILHLSLSNPIQTFLKQINFNNLQANNGNYTFLPVRQNCPKDTFLQKYLIFRKYIDKIHDFDFESFIVSRKVAQIVLENIHFSSHYSFNLEFLIILKYFRFQITEIPIDIDYSKPKWTFKDRIKSFFSMFGLLIALFADFYNYTYRMPLKIKADDQSFFSRIDL